MKHPAAQPTPCFTNLVLSDWGSPIPPQFLKLYRVEKSHLPSRHWISQIPAAPRFGWGKIATRKVKKI
jgi:hypothetical protein